MRDDALEGQRPKLGRPKLSASSSDSPLNTDEEIKLPASPETHSFPADQYAPVDLPRVADRDQHSDKASSRPIRATRNKNPLYT